MKFDKLKLMNGILQIVAAYDEKIDSRIRLQKSAYILKSIGVENFAKVSFDYQSQGPYSREVADIVEELIAAELLIENKSESGYSYQLTEGGKEWIQNSTSEDVSITLKVSELKLKEKPNGVLELLSRTIFLRCEDENIQDESKAFNLATAQNPNLKDASIETEARNLLQVIQGKIPDGQSLVCGVNSQSPRAFAASKK